MKTQIKIGKFFGRILLQIQPWSKYMFQSNIASVSKKMLRHGLTQ